MEQQAPKREKKYFEEAQEKEMRTLANHYHSFESPFSLFINIQDLN